MAFHDHGGEALVRSRPTWSMTANRTTHTCMEIMGGGRGLGLTARTYAMRN